MCSEAEIEMSQQSQQNADQVWVSPVRLEQIQRGLMMRTCTEVTAGFYPNVTTLRSGLCYRQSVCRLSVVCLSVTLVHPTHGVGPFDKISSPLCTLAILWPQCKKFKEIVPGNPSRGSVKRKSGSKIQQFWPVEGYMSLAVQDRRIVSIKDEGEVLRTLSNGDIADKIG